MTVAPPALPLRAVELVNRGAVTRIVAWAYAAGGAPEVQARRVLKSCVDTLRGGGGKVAPGVIEQVLERRA